MDEKYVELRLPEHCLILQKFKFICLNFTHSEVFARIPGIFIYKGFFWVLQQYFLTIYSILSFIPNYPP